MSEIGNLVISWIMCGITFGSIIMYGALGEILTEKSGNMNLGTPGIMYRRRVRIRRRVSV